MRDFLNWLFHRRQVRRRLDAIITRHKPDYRDAWLNANNK